MSLAQHSNAHNIPFTSVVRTLELVIFYVVDEKREGMTRHVNHTTLQANIWW